MAKLAYAQWPWGAESKDQFIRSCKDLSELGYHYFESVRSFVDVFMGDVRSFLDLTEEYDLRPISFYFHLSEDPEEDVRQLKSKIEFVRTCGIKTICVQGVYGAGGDDALLRRTLDTIREYGAICADYGVLPCVHPHANTPVMYENEIDFIMENTDPGLIGFAPDTAHLLVGECDPVKVCEKYKERIAFTHIKDVRGPLISSGMQSGVGVYSNFLELGEGSVNLDGVFGVLKSVGYKGFLCVELDSPPEDNAKSAKKNMEYMKAHWGAFEE